MVTKLTDMSNGDTLAGFAAACCCHMTSSFSTGNQIYELKNGLLADCGSLSSSILCTC